MKLTAVLKASFGWTPGWPSGFNGKWPWTRSWAYSSSTDTKLKASTDSM